MKCYFCGVGNSRIIRAASDHFVYSICDNNECGAELSLNDQEVIEENIKLAKTYVIPPLLHCPFCGLVPDVDPLNLDLLYPTNSSRRLYKLHCVESQGGCGASILGRNPEQCVRTWQKRV